MTDWLSFNSQLANYSACNSQTPESQTRKPQVHILEALEFRLCVQRDSKIVVWIMLIPQAHIFKQEINTKNFILNEIKCYFYLHRVPNFLRFGTTKDVKEICHSNFERF